MSYTAPTISVGALGSVAGYSATAAAYITPHQLPLNMGDKLHKWWEEETPTASLIMRIRKDSTERELFEHLEDKEVPHWITVSADESSVGTPITITSHYTRLQNFDMLYNPRTNGWRMVATSYTTPGSAADATVDVAYNIGCADSIWLAGDQVIRYTNAFPEGTTAGKSIQTTKEKWTGYVQTIRHATEMTYPVAATPMLGEKNERNLQLAKLRAVHKRAISDMLFIGPASGDIGTSGANWGHKVSAGIFGMTGAHRWILNNGLYFDDLASFAAGPMRWSRGDMILATSQRVINIITSWSDSMVRITMNDKMWGREVTSLFMNGRKIGLFHEKLFDENDYLSRKAVLLNPNNIVWRIHKGNGFSFDTQVRQDILKEDAPERFKDEIVTHGGYEFFFEAAFGIIDGIDF